MARVIFVFLFVALIGIVVQATLIHALFPSAIAPDFLLMLVIALALRFRTVPALVGAFLLGLLGDFSSGQFLGPCAGGSVAAFCFVGVLAEKIYAEKGAAVVFLAFFASLVKSAVQLLMILFYVNVNLFDQTGLTIVFAEAMLTAIITPFVLWILHWRALHPIYAQRAAHGGIKASFRWSESLK